MHTTPTQHQRTEKQNTCHHNIYNSWGGNTNNRPDWAGGRRKDCPSTRQNKTDHDNNTTNHYWLPNRPIYPKPADKPPSSWAGGRIHAA